MRMQCNHTIVKSTNWKLRTTLRHDAVSSQVDLHSATGLNPLFAHTSIDRVFNEDPAIDQALFEVALLRPCVDYVSGITSWLL